VRVTLGSVEATTALRAWIELSLQRELTRDSRYRNLRRAIHQALALDPQLYALALRSRTYKHNRVLGNDAYELAWRHEKILKRVQRENPHLLRLVAIALKSGKLRGRGDPVAKLKRALKMYGITEKGWRIITHNSERIFDSAIRMSENGAFAAIVHYTRFLERLHLPSVPPARFVESLFRLFCYDERDTLDFYGSWCTLPLCIVRCGFLEALKQSTRREQLKFLEEEFLLVANWYHKVQPKLDDNQKRAGWPWLWKQQQRWREQQRFAAHAQGARWDSAITECRVDGFLVQAVNDAAALFREGQEMRHCAADRLDLC
jgi:hypothetical protein